MLGGEESEESERYYRMRVGIAVLGKLVDLAIGCFLPPVILQVIVITTFSLQMVNASGGNT